MSIKGFKGDFDFGSTFPGFFGISKYGCVGSHSRAGIKGRSMGYVRGSKSRI